MPIKLKVHKIPEINESLCGVVRVTPEAEMIIKQLQRETGLSGRYILSQIIIQAANIIEIEEV
jgi:hypothetical protein